MPLYLFEFSDPADEMSGWVELVEAKSPAVAAHMLIDPDRELSVAGATLPAEGDCWTADCCRVAGVGGRMTRETENVGAFTYTNRGGRVVLTHTGVAVPEPPK